MSDSGRTIGQHNGEGIVVVHPDKGILSWTCSNSALKAKVTFMENYCDSHSERKWERFVADGFRLQRVALVPISPPFEGVAHFTLAFEKATDQPTT